MYLNEVGKETSQEHSFKQPILVAVLIVERHMTIALTSTRNQPGFMQVLAELRDETCSIDDGTRESHFVKKDNK